MDRPDNIEIYDEHAPQLAMRYESTTTEKALPAFAHIFRQYSGRNLTALDIGSGSGRDAFWMAEQGWNVDAVDGSTALLDEARKLHPHPNIHYMQDLAPDFSALQERGRLYNIILMSAFIFHFEKPQRDNILRFCAERLAPSGLMHITLRQGPLPPDRNIFHVPAKEIEDFARQNNLSAQHHGSAKDSMGMDGITWDNISVWRGDTWNQVKDYSL